MSGYIDADAFLKSVKQKAYPQSGSVNESERKISLFGIMEILTAIPTADVREVVRCKDCKYMCHYTDGHLECRLLSDLKPIPTTYCTMKADDFCSYGERRKAGNE